MWTCEMLEKARCAKEENEQRRAKRLNRYSEFDTLERNFSAGLIDEAAYDEALTNLMRDQ